MSDGASSITKSLRTTKVLSGYANNAYSDVRQNLANASCPVRLCQDDYGREVDCHTVNTVSEMCPFDPMFRIDIENSLRPAYSVDLNNDGIRGDYTDGDLQHDTDRVHVNRAAFGGYDTMGIRRDESHNLNGRMQMPRQTYGDNMDFYRNQELFRKSMQGRYQSQRFKAAGAQ